MRTPRISCLLIGVLTVASAARADDAGSAFFESKIRPVLIAHCYECHSQKAKKPKGGLLLDSRDSLRKGGETGPALMPGKPGASRLIKAIGYADEALQMPPKGKLPDAVIADLVTWVEMGAPDPRISPADGGRKPDSAGNITEGRKHWSFQPPRNTPVPAVIDSGWPQSDIDRFVLAKLEAKGLQPAVAADRATLLRRVSFDLIGLAPTPAESEAFLRDRSSNAFEKVVDRLLASPAFGDRWGRHWLDLAQYADTISVDRLFPDRNAWRYRDYVIRAFNEDKPFDRFLREQIAGDLIPSTDDRERAERIVATAFLTHGPHQTINQFKEQLRWDIVDNQVGKIGQVFLGLTLQCARCHDHKFDPVLQTDYYALAGIFQNLQMLNGFLGDSKVFSDWVRVPLPENPEQRSERDEAMIAHARTTVELERRLQESKAKVGGLQKRLKDMEAAKNREGEAPAEPRRRAKPSRPEPRPPNAGRDSDASLLQTELATAEQQVRDLSSQLIDHLRCNSPEAPSIFAAKEASQPSNARVTIRGNAYQLGDEVPRGFVQVVQVSKSVKVPSDVSGRLQLADWLTDPKNPLTARVAVNRIWHHIFGAGLVRSVDNFGLRGELPTHPQLLDYLALRFVEQGWSMKKMIRELVLSRTYQLSSDHNPSAYASDPDNKLLWRMNRRRLDAEAIRDAILQLSGEFDLARGGPVLPPAGWLEGAVNGYALIKGEPPPPAAVANRRTIYLPVFRRPPPWADGLTLFNAAIPSVITGARSVTTVPTQSLYLMNSPFLIEQGRKAAGRLLARSELDDAGRLRAFYVRALSRPAREEEVDRGLEFIGRMASEGSRSEAWGLFCHTVLASNEFLTRF